jgi:hypothetical protein
MLTVVVGEVPGDCARLPRNQTVHQAAGGRGLQAGALPRVIDNPLPTLA